MQEIRLANFRQPNRQNSLRSRIVSSDSGHKSGSQLPIRPVASPEAEEEVELEIAEGVVELTRNSKYCVSKLSGVPSVVKGPEEIFDGVTDQSTGFALVQSARGSFVWHYRSPDHAPNVIAFTDEKGTGSSLAVLVKASSGSLEPGLYMIDATSGKSTYWESVGSAVADGLLRRRKGIQHQVPIYGGEEIENIQNVEPAGVVVTTSNGRFILVTLRDQFGKPKLNHFSMYGGGNGFLSSFNVAARFSSTQRDIASVKPCSIIGRTERQVLFINSSGDISLWECSRTGNSRKLFGDRLKDTLISVVEGVYPDVRKSFQTHDVEYHEEARYIFVLASFLNSSQGNSLRYMLYTLTVTDDGNLQIFSSYYIQSYSGVSVQPPKLYLPKPSKTLFAVFSNAVVLLDSIPEKTSGGLLARWEDSICLRNDTEIVGAGIEDAHKTGLKFSSNAGIVLIAADYGVIRVERLSEKNNVSQNLVDNKTESPSNLQESMAKSKIEQAVFYGEKDSNPIDFVARREQTFDRGALEVAALDVSREILSTESAYIPPEFPSLSEHLNLRVIYLGKLANYLRTNFPDAISVNGRFQLLWDLEKSSSTGVLWDYADNLLQNDAPVNTLLKVAQQLSGDKGSIRDWFLHKAAEIDKLMISCSKYCSQSHTFDILLDVNEILIRGVTKAALERRAHYLEGVYRLISDEDFSTERPWTCADELINAFETQYELSEKSASSLKDANKRRIATQLVNIVETLCSLYKERIQWFSSKGTDKADALQTQFLGKQLGWVMSLVELNEKQAALQIAERYHIYRALVEIIGDDWTLARQSGDALKVEDECRYRFNGYIGLFGYPFAEVLYQYWVDKHQFNLLLTEFPNYRNFLDQFFEDGKHSQISWISDVEGGNYERAGRLLASVGDSNNDESTSSKLVQLSIAKLCILADANNGSDDSWTGDEKMDNQGDSEMVENINHALEEVETQELLLRQSKLVDVPAGSLVGGLKAEGYEGLATVTSRAISRLNNNSALSTDELVDLLTIFPADPFGVSKFNFVRALKLVEHDNNDTRRHVNQQLIWSRLFGSDNWKTLGNSKNKSDQKVKSISESTLLYVTLSEAIKEGLLDQWSIELLSNNPIASATKKISPDQLQHRYGFADVELIKKIEQDIRKHDEQLQATSEKYDVGSWIKGIFSRLQM